MQFGITDSATIAIEIRGVDLLALKLISILMHAYAQNPDNLAGEEHKMLATNLDDLIRQIEVKLADVSLEFIPVEHPNNWKPKAGDTIGIIRPIKG